MKSMISRRVLAKWALAAPIAVAAAREAAAQVGSPGGEQGPHPETRDLADLHRAALAEGGQLVVYAGGDLPNGSAATEAAFMKRFPGMKIRILVDRSKYHGVRIDNQLAVSRLQCDAAHILAFPYFDRWRAGGHLLAYKPLGWEQIYPDFREPDGSIVSVAVYAFGPLTNTSLLGNDAPADMIDFLAPRYKGKIALTYPHDDDSVLYQFHRLVSQYGWDFMVKLDQQDVAWNRGSGVTRDIIAKGQRALSFTTSGPLVAGPGPLRLVLPKSDTFLSWAHPAAIFRKARHPEAAKLYMSWLLSPELQGTGRQWSVRRDMPDPTGMGPLSAYNTSPAQFRSFLRDRAAVEVFRDQLEQYIGPMTGPNPTNVVGVFPEPA
jgi:ABC-type Fe3+ transport system substrate-binding protein